MYNNKGLMQVLSMVTREQNDGIRFLHRSIVLFSHNIFSMHYNIFSQMLTLITFLIKGTYINKFNVHLNVLQKSSYPGFVVF